MRPDVTINGTSMKSLGWLRESISFPVPQSQTESTTVPGRNSPIRFSVVNNRISYKPRTFKIVLAVLAERKDFMTMVSKAAQLFAGVLSKVVLSERPDVYAYGTLQLENEYDTDTNKGTLTISCEDGDSFLYHASKTTVKQTGNGSVALPNDFMPAVPSITVTADTTLSWQVDSENMTKTLSSGTWIVPELELLAGDNSVTVTTTGDVTFEYQEGCL